MDSDNQNTERETLIYLAGLLDADGYFSIGVSDSIMNHGRPNPQWFESAGLKQVTPLGPRLLHETFGGWHGNEKPSAPGGKPLFTWRVTHITAGRCIERLLPFLRIKQRQAEIVLQLSIHKSKNKNRKLTTESIAIRQSLRDQVRALNDTRHRNTRQSVKQLHEQE
jgi:hypothetical protein